MTTKAIAAYRLAKHLHQELEHMSESAAEAQSFWKNKDISKHAYYFKGGRDYSDAMLQLVRRTVYHYFEMDDIVRIIEEKNIPEITTYDDDEF